jgi:hypothetical protein
MQSEDSLTRISYLRQFHRLGYCLLLCRDRLVAHPDLQSILPELTILDEGGSQGSEAWDVWEGEPFRPIARALEVTRAAAHEGGHFCAGAGCRRW